MRKVEREETKKIHKQKLQQEQKLKNKRNKESRRPPKMKNEKEYDIKNWPYRANFIQQQRIRNRNLSKTSSATIDIDDYNLYGPESLF